MGGNRQILQDRVLLERLALFFEPLPDKVLARRIDCTERTARHFRSGTAWPNARHWWNIWVEFGDDVLEALYHPERVEARLNREAEERDQARRTRLASALVESRSFGLGAGLGEGSGQDQDPLEPGPPNLDLFDEVRP